MKEFDKGYINCLIDFMMNEPGLNSTIRDVALGAGIVKGELDEAIELGMVPDNVLDAVKELGDYLEDWRPTVPTKVPDFYGIADFIEPLTQADEFEIGDECILTEPIPYSVNKLTGSVYRFTPANMRVVISNIYKSQDYRDTFIVIKDMDAWSDVSVRKEVLGYYAKIVKKGKR